MLSSIGFLICGWAVHVKLEIRVKIKTICWESDARHTKLVICVHLIKWINCWRPECFTMYLLNYSFCFRSSIFRLIIFREKWWMIKYSLCERRLSTSYFWTHSLHIIIRYQCIEILVVFKNFKKHNRIKAHKLCNILRFKCWYIYVRVEKVKKKLKLSRTYKR